jgi:hypothetical protein
VSEERQDWPHFARRSALQGGGIGNYIFAAATSWVRGLRAISSRARRLHTEALQQRTSVLEQEQEARARAAVAEERARIARDLHAVVAHSVSVIVVQAGAERLALPEEATSTWEVLGSIEETGLQALIEMRRLVGDDPLSPGGGVLRAAGSGSRRRLQEPNQVGDGAVAVVRMAKRELAVDLVLVASSVAGLGQIAGLL